MAIEIIPRKGGKEPTPLEGKIFQAGIALAVLLVFSSLIFYFFGWRFSREISTTVRLMREQKTEEITSLENKIGGYYKKAKNLPLIVETKKSSLPFLELMEKSVHPFVYFPEFNVNVSGNSINATGLARNIVAYDQQLRIFREEESILSVNAPEFEIKEDRTVEFPINIVFK